MTDPQPVVTVLDNTPDGTMVSWFCNLDSARNHRATIDVTAAGIKLWVDLDKIPDGWITAAKAAHQALKDGSDEQLAAVSRLATHRNRFPGGGGPLDPVAGSAET